MHLEIDAKDLPTIQYRPGERSSNLDNSYKDSMCQLAAGDYLKIWVPGTKWLSRAYSIGNAPRADGTLEVQLHRVPGERFSNWAFDEAKIGDQVTARGPIGNFRLRSARETPLLFVACGTLHCETD